VARGELSSASLADLPAVAKVLRLEGLFDDAWALLE
jgi:hypothetical protein